MTDNSQFTLPNDQPIVDLDCKTAFANLTSKEKLYAHHLSQASWHGGLIVFVQTSPEAPLIFVLLHKLLASQPLTELKTTAIEKIKLTEEEYQVSLQLKTYKNYKY